MYEAIAAGIRVAKSGNLGELYHAKAEGITGVMNRVLEEGLKGLGRETVTTMMLMKLLKRATEDMGIITAPAAAGRDLGVDWIELSLLLLVARLILLAIATCSRER